MDAIGRLEIDDAVFQSKKSEIPPLAHKTAREKMGALLPDEDTAGFHELAGEALDAAPFGIRIAAVFGTA